MMTFPIYGKIKNVPNHQPGIYTIWLFNIAMENGPFMDDFPIKTSIYKGFSMAMLNNQRVYPYTMLWPAWALSSHSWRLLLTWRQSPKEPPEHQKKYRSVAKKNIGYPLVNIRKAMENHQGLMGKSTI